MTGGLTDDMVFYYYTTSQAAPLSITVNGVTTPAQWINSTPPGRRSTNFGSTLFPGTGDPAKLPTQATLTLLLRLTAGRKAPSLLPPGPSRPEFPANPASPVVISRKERKFFALFPEKPLTSPASPAILIEPL